MAGRERTAATLIIGCLLFVLFGFLSEAVG
jgi:hypothetical protein